DGACANSYTLTRTWTATDACGNEVTHEQVITVEDTTAPEFVGTLPADATYSCAAEVPVAPVLEAVDNCSVDVNVDYEEVKEDGDCSNRFILTRTWTVTDECGNTNVHEQIITVADNQKPELTGTAYRGETNINTCMADAVV